MSRARSRAVLIGAQQESLKKQRAEYEEIMNANQAAAERSSWGNLIGSIGLPLIAGLLTGGLSLGATALLAGIGSRVGSEIGEHDWSIQKAWDQTGGVQTPELTKQGFGAEQRLQYGDVVEEAYGGFGEKQWMDATTAAVTSLIAGGGKQAWAQSGAVDELGFAYAEDMAPGVWDRIGTTLKSDWQFDPSRFYSAYKGEG